MMLATLAMIFATTDDSRLIAITDAKTAPLMLDLAKRCHITAKTRPRPFEPNAQIPIQWLDVLADKPIKESDPRIKCYHRLIRGAMPTAIRVSGL
jgi:hypothetical protein